MKQCRTCKQWKELTDFHKTNRYKDGIETKCKMCARQYKKSRWHLDKKTSSINNKRHYIKNRDTILERNYKYYKTEQGKSVSKKSNKNQILKYPEKYKAKNDLNNAVKYGRIIKPNDCSLCGKECKLRQHLSKHDAKHMSK